MRATIQRVRECVYEMGIYKVSCLDLVINSKIRFTNGEYVILVQGSETFVLKLKKMFDFRPEESEIELEIGDDVTSYIPADLLSSV